MNRLVVGASGATGKRLVEQLLQSGQRVKVIVRSIISIPDHWKNNEHLCILTKHILEFTPKALSEIISD